MSWSTRLLIGLTLLIVGAAAATWALARYDTAARFLGVKPATQAIPQRAVASPSAAPVTPQPLVQAQASAQVATLEARLARVESATQRAEGSAGRADALVVAFAARRAIDRGVALGYLEPLLVDRFGAQHPQAVATIVTAAHEPVRLNQLVSDYEALAPALRGGGGRTGLWAGFQRELGSLVEVRRSNHPSTKPDARYQRALARLSAGEVDAALAETMRLPGGAQAGAWIARARRYIAAHRALDEVESAALLPSSAPAR